MKIPRDVDDIHLYIYRENFKNCKLAINLTAESKQEALECKNSKLDADRAASICI